MNATVQHLRARRHELAESARRNIAARVDSNEDFEELSLMLGLTAQSPSGQLYRCCPWDADDGLGGPAPRPSHADTA